MSRWLLAFSIVLVSAVAILSMAPSHAPRTKCKTSCNISDHMAMMSAGATLAVHGMQGMQGMPDMPPARSTSSPSPRPSPANTAASARPPQGAAADVMLQSMNDMRMLHGGHMTMTMAMPANAADQQHAGDILAALRTAIEPLKDYRVAEAAGYQQFLPQLPQAIYHFTNYHNAFLNEFGFDPARPTSLMYKTVPGGYELAGVMYTAPANSTNEQLNSRVPLSVATWHLHTNLCLPPPDKRLEMWSAHPQFGLAGSITTADACAQAGGSFKPVIYNWMVHVWPLETDPAKIWATEEHPGAMDH